MKNLIKLSIFILLGIIVLVGYGGNCGSLLNLAKNNSGSSASDTIRLTLAGSYATPDAAFGVYVSGNYVYVADWASGLQIINISNPASPTLTGSYDTPVNPGGVYVSGDYAYVADDSSGLLIIGGVK